MVADQYIEYQLDNGQYAVVVPMDRISASEAKKMARQRAAEITVSRGDRYFTIVAEQETRVIRSDQGNQQMNGNLYQELIIEKDFDRDRLRTETLPQASNIGAIRLVFTSSPTKGNWKSIDACTLTDCR